jgi:hypothetical protein
MENSGGVTHRPTPGNPQPRYNHACQFCFRPLAYDGRWLDHNNTWECPDGDGYAHAPDGEEEDESHAQ